MFSQIKCLPSISCTGLSTNQEWMIRRLRASYPNKKSQPLEQFLNLSKLSKMKPLAGGKANLP